MKTIKLQTLGYIAIGLTILVDIITTYIIN